MRLTILGCGPSGGVPILGSVWGECDPREPKNYRLRPSVLFEVAGRVFLIDTTPDVRQQLLQAQVTRVDAVFYTHDHADHIGGIDDLRSMNWLMRGGIPIYGNARTLNGLATRYAYLFQKSERRDRFLTAVLEPREICGSFAFEGVQVVVIEQDHGQGGLSLGYRIGDVAYCTDVKAFAPQELDKLRGLKVLVLDCVEPESHPSHLSVPEALEIIDRLQPERAFLTHMSHKLDYRALCEQLPSHVRPAYDGLSVLTDDVHG